MKQPVALDSVGSLIATRPAAPAKNTAPASETAQPFGAMLSREMENRQNAGRVDTPAPGARNGGSGNNSNNNNSPAAPHAATNQDAAGLRSRQEAQRSQEQRDARTQQDERAAASAADQSSAASAAPAAAAGNASTATTAAATSASSGKSADDDHAADGATDAAALAAQAGAPASSAAAALQALVASMAPKAAASAAAGTELAIDAKAAGARVGTAVTTGAAKADAEDAAQAHDPAFDALLAQATQSSQVREAGKHPVSARTLMVDGETGGAAANRGATLPAPADGLPAANLMAKADARLAAPALPAALLRPETDTVAALPGANAALGAGILQATGAAAANGTDILAPRVGTPAWDHALGQKVVWMAAGAEQSASLTLNPPDLGPVQVVINVSNAQADASFTAAQPETRAALEAALPKLKEMLADAGIALGQTSVGAGSSNQQGMHERQHAAGAARRGNAGAAAVEDSSAVAAATQPAARQVIGTGLVNTFA